MPPILEILISIVRILAAAYAILAVIALLFANSMMFQPQSASYGDTPDIIKLKTADGVIISAVHLPNPAARFTILYSHGNGEDLGDVLPRLEEFRRRGYGVFSYDYHGYGTSGGRPTEQKALHDIAAAYDYLVGKLGVAPERILAHGFSLGSGPSVDLAVRRPVGGVVIESGFVSAFRTVTRVPLLPFDRFNNIAKLGRLKVPVLIIHGDRDQVVPYGHGVKLFKAAPPAKRFLPVAGADHYNLQEMAGDRYWQSLKELEALIMSSRIPSSMMNSQKPES